MSLFWLGYREGYGETAHRAQVLDGSQVLHPCHSRYRHRYRTDCTPLGSERRLGVHARTDRIISCLDTIDCGIFIDSQVDGSNLGLTLWPPCWAFRRMVLVCCLSSPRMLTCRILHSSSLSLLCSDHTWGYWEAEWGGIGFRIFTMPVTPHSGYLSHPTQELPVWDWDTVDSCCLMLNPDKTEIIWTGWGEQLGDMAKIAPASYIEDVHDLLFLSLGILWDPSWY